MLCRENFSVGDFCHFPRDPALVTHSWQKEKKAGYQQKEQICLCFTFKLFSNLIAGSLSEEISFLALTLTCQVRGCRS